MLDQLTYFFNLKNVTRNDFWSLDFEESTITENNRFESEGLLQLVDDGTGLELLDETNRGIEQEQSTNNTEIHPILKTSSQYSGSLSQKISLAYIIHRRFPVPSPWARIHPPFKASQG
jgi:hypothetical protein